MFKSEREVLKFQQSIRESGVPIDIEDAYLFGHALLEEHPPIGILQRLSKALMYVDKETFTTNLDCMSELCKRFTEKDYTLLIYGKNKSEFWVYQQLLKRGLNPAAEIVDNPGLTRSGFLERFERGEQFVAVDDMAISGARIRHDLFGQALNYSFPEQYRSQSRAVVGNATNYAKKSISSGNILIESLGLDIPILTEVLKENEVVWMQRLCERLYETGVLFEEEGVGQDAVLFWSWYKIPDNVPEIFTGIGFPPLIRKENVTKEY
jgi:hypothetical protein